MMRRWTPAVASACLVAALAGEAAACPNCKEAVANQPGGSDAAGLADGYSYSILLMMAMPFALLGTGAFVVTRAVKRGAFPEF